MSKRVINFGASPKRKAESLGAQVIPLRSDRFFKLADSWYFTTRENVTLGPFESRELARAAVDDFIAFIETASPKIVEAFTSTNTQQAGVLGV